MSARHKPAQIDAQWLTDRAHRASAATKSPVGDELGLPSRLGTVEPLTDELRADAVWTVACAETTTADDLRVIAQALGCTLADVQLGLRHLREARARREAAA